MNYLNKNILSGLMISILTPILFLMTPTEADESEGSQSLEIIVPESEAAMTEENGETAKIDGEEIFLLKDFVGWRGQLKKGRGNPKYSFQLTAANLFDARDLVATGNNARYTDGRRLSLKASIQF